MVLESTGFCGVRGWGWIVRLLKEFCFRVLKTLKIFKAFLGEKKTLRSVLRKSARKVIGRLR